MKKGVRKCNNLHNNSAYYLPSRNPSFNLASFGDPEAFHKELICFDLPEADYIRSLFKSLDSISYKCTHDNGCLYFETKSAIICISSISYSYNDYRLKISGFVQSRFTEFVQSFNASEHYEILYFEKLCKVLKNLSKIFSKYPQTKPIYKDTDANAYIMSFVGGKIECYIPDGFTSKLYCSVVVSPFCKRKIIEYRGSIIDFGNRVDEAYASYKYTLSSKDAIEFVNNKLNGTTSNAYHAKPKNFKVSYERGKDAFRRLSDQMEIYGFKAECVDDDGVRFVTDNVEDGIIYIVKARMEPETPNRKYCDITGLMFAVKENCIIDLNGKRYFYDKSSGSFEHAFFGSIESLDIFRRSFIEDGKIKALIRMVE